MNTINLLNPRSLFSNEVENKEEEINLEEKLENIEEKLENLQEKLEQNLQEKLENLRENKEFYFFDNYTTLHTNFDFDSNKKNFTLITGEIQSGKTSTALVLSHKSIIQKRPVVYVILNRNVGKYQVQDRLVIYNNDFRKFCLKNDIDFKPIEYAFVQDLSDDTTKISSLLLNNGLIIVYCNTVQLYRFLEEHQKVNIKYTLIVDEIDYQDKDNGNTEVKVVDYYNELVNRSVDYIGLSATNFKIFYTSESLYTHRMFTLENRKNYKSILDITRNYNIPEDITCPSNTESFSKDYQFQDMIKSLSKKSPIEYKDKINGKNRIHPIILLYKISRFVYHHDQVFEYIKTNYSKKWCAITFNYKGIKFYHKDLTGIISINNVQIKPDKENNYTIKGTSISNVLSLLRKFYKNEIISNKHIIIISGNLVSRQISYTCNQFIWHLTHMRLLSTSSKPDCTNLLQEMRLCGIYNRDDITPEISVTDSSYSNIIKAYKIQKKMCRKSIKKANEKLSVKEYLFGRNEYSLRFRKETIPDYKLHRIIPKSSVLTKEEKIVEENQEKSIPRVIFLKDMNKPNKIFFFNILKDYVNRNECDNEEEEVWCQISKCFENEEYNEKYEKTLFHAFTKAKPFSSKDIDQDDNFIIVKKDTYYKILLNPNILI
jgi:hypothetical protein